MPGPGNLDNYPGLVMPWILEESLQLLLYLTSIIPKHIPNTHPYTCDKSQRTRKSVVCEVVSPTNAWAAILMKCQ